SIILWNVEQGREVARIPGAHHQTIWGLAFSPDGMTMASGGKDGGVAFWNVADTAHPRRQWDSGAAEPPPAGQADRVGINGVAFSPDGKWFASAGQDGRILL